MLTNAEASPKKEKQLSTAVFIIVGICWLALIFEGYDLVVYGTVTNALLRYKPWELNAAQVGAIGSYVVIGMLFGALFVGILTDLIGRKITFIACITVFSLSMGVCAIAPTPTVFGLFRFIAGLGLGGVIPTATAVTIEYAPPSWRSFTYALMFTGYSVGGILASLLALAFIPTFGWRIMFGVGVLPIIITVPVTLFFLPESLGFLFARNREAEVEAIARRFNIALDSDTLLLARQEAESADPTKKLRNLAILFTPDYVLASIVFPIATFMVLFLIFGVNTWLPQFMIKTGYSVGSSFVFLLVLNVGNIVGTCFGGRAMDRFGCKPVSIVSLLLAVISFALLSTKWSLPLTYLIVAFAGFGSLGSQTILNSYISRFYPLQSRATAVGWSLGIGRLGGILGPIVGGLLLNAHVGVQWNFYVFALAGLPGAIILLLVADCRTSDEQALIAQALQSSMKEPESTTEPVKSSISAKEYEI